MKRLWNILFPPRNIAELNRDDRRRAYIGLHVDTATAKAGRA